jgi:predicted DNA-binding transcriptional regulator AlpA
MPVTCLFEPSMRYEQFGIRRAKNGLTLLLHRYLTDCSDELSCNVVAPNETYCYVSQHIIMPVLIDETTYYSVAEIAKGLGISRSTFWRWRSRSEGNIPTGRRYRGGKMVVFTEEEVEAIREFANRLEPVQRPNRDQMKLFNGVR